MAFEILVTCIAASHVITIALLVVWFGLGKPLSVKEFGRRFKREYLQIWQRFQAD